jgi:hypothetical protein
MLDGLQLQAFLEPGAIDAEEVFDGVMGVLGIS